MKKVLLALLITAFPAQVWAGGCGCGSVRAIVTAAKSETIQAVNAYTAAEAQAIRSEILLAAQNIIGTIKTESATIVRALVALKESNAATLKGQAVAGEAMKTEDMYGKAAQPAGLCGSSSLGAGILTGKFKEPPKPEAGDKRANFYPFFSEPFWSKTQELLKTLRAIAEEHDKPVTHVSINWVSQQKGMTCALTGSKNVDQAIMNAAAVDWDLSAEELARIDAAYDRIFRE